MEEVSVVSAQVTEGSAVQLCGLRIGDGLYAIPVLKVQEVIKPQLVTTVPLAPDYVNGLINLRGQIVTSINMKKLFKLDNDEYQNYMNVIVRSDDGLYSLVVDEILDVIDVDNSSFEDTPDSLDQNIKQFIDGVYKLDKKLLILLSLDKILNLDIA